MQTYEFQETLMQSHTHDSTAINYLQSFFTNCSAVTTSETLSEEKSGIDFVVHLYNGKKYKVDVKYRERGASKYWKNGVEELAIELWSIKPGSYYNFEECDDCVSQLGWTIDDTKQTDYVMYIFDSNDSKNIYILDFVLLQNCVLKNGRNWYNTYKHAEQQTTTKTSWWASEIMFVPVDVVKNAM